MNEAEIIYNAGKRGPYTTKDWQGFPRKKKKQIKKLMLFANSLMRFRK